ncbi:glycoside hydrolase family 38 C-terminal domain-containing protein [Devosia sp. YIM 151766]|uniref:glycoside hydrolase family 38 N-terminal domain-containing protein n=1 Tax=Devosia sp. YIM 151766 TaxID=3017325 RepID=UPI00255C9C34|nr:glycoside hydrolase family 38 C-terminal domain-containing protein [Devosia sp. YIM 151766]WIY53851.1 glycoside hydrolase family 38 C-terminal domain-containing protein [Devosia sp. YIM 151766]
MTIKELLVINHTHTDFGYTDYADTLFRHQRDIIDDALDLVDHEQGRDPDSQFKWTCEVSAITADWFRHASDAQKDRFRDLYGKGLVGVGAMPVHWTPLISPANAIRSLKHLHLLKQEGVEAKIAMQCDVNGLGWFWSDILLDLGVEGFLLEPNPHRGMRFNDMMRIFNWKTPSGRELFTVHGWHYSVGVNTFFFGDDDMERTQSTIDRVLGELDKRGQYPFDKAILPVTNPAAPDNGFATRGISDFIERWNAEGRTPRLRMATVEQAMSEVRDSVAKSGVTLDSHAGDWSDFWVDGVASTAYETMLARSAERLLPVIDLLAGFAEKGDTTLLDKAAEEIQYYDEHTWGAFCSVHRPDSPFTRIQLSWKTARAHNGFALAQETVRKEAQKRVREVVDGNVEGDFRLRRIDRHGDKGPTSRGLPMPVSEQSYYVMNPSSVARSVYWPVLHDHAGSSPQTILDAYVSEKYLTGMQVRDGDLPSETHVIAVDLPPFGEAVVKPVPVRPAGGISSGATWIENDRYRLEIDPRDGSLKSLFDKQASRECVSGEYPLGQVLYETLQKPGAGRFATFGGDYDWSHMETVVWPEKTEFSRRSADKVVVDAVRQNSMGIEIGLTLAWSHGDTMTVTYRLPHQGQGIEMDTMIHKLPVTTPESLYVCFGAPGGSPQIRLDVGDRIIDPATQQVPLSCEAWIGIQGFAALGTDAGALVVASPDAPLVQPFGIQTENAGSGRKGNDPSLAFWVLNNHWDTNFALTQSGGIPARFRLLPQATLDIKEARSFAETTGTAPVIVRAYNSQTREAAPLLRVDGNDEVITRIRKAWDGDGIVVTLVNQSDRSTDLALELPGHDFAQVQLVDPMEQVVSDQDLKREGSAVRLTMAAGGTTYLRFAR